MGVSAPRRPRNPRRFVGSGDGGCAANIAVSHDDDLCGGALDVLDPTYPACVLVSDVTSIDVPFVTAGEGATCSPDAFVNGAPKETLCCIPDP